MLPVNKLPSMLVFTMVNLILLLNFILIVLSIARNIFYIINRFILGIHIASIFMRISSIHYST